MGLLDGLTKKLQNTVSKVQPKMLNISNEDIERLLIKDEQIMEQISQIGSITPLTLVLTNFRVIVLGHGITKTDIKDYYFRDIKDFNFGTKITGAVITINANYGNNFGIIQIDKLPLDDAKSFYQKIQEIEQFWYEKKREMDLEEKRASSGASNIVITQEPKLDNNTNDIEEKLLKLKTMYEKGLISEQDFNDKKSKILDVF